MKNHLERSVVTLTGNVVGVKGRDKESCKKVINESLTVKQKDLVQGICKIWVYLLCYLKQSYRMIGFIYKIFE